jgi:membrane dipeptidase
MRTRQLALTLSVSIIALSIGCRPTQESPVPETDLHARAERLAHEVLLLDTHIDLPYRLHDEPEDVTVRTESGHFDLVRAREGGLDAAFMSIYIPAKLQETGGARELADELIDLVESIAAAAPDSFAVAQSPTDVRALFEQRIFALPMGIENGAAIEDDLSALEHFYVRGVRYMTLTHSEPNLICDSSYSTDRPWGGLSDFGRQVVAEMNRLGIMVDVSHVTDDTVLQALEISKAPMIASHSCCRYFTPGFERNLSDELITRLAEAGGVVQIAFAPSFLTEAAQEQSTELWAIMTRFMEEHDVGFNSPEFKERVDLYYEQHPKVETSVRDVADHILHVIEIAGIDHVGIGSDFDGISSGPTGLEDVSKYPNLIEELLRRGLSEDDIRKICGENLLRVWSEVERTARELQSSSRSHG